MQSFNTYANIDDEIKSYVSDEIIRSEQIFNFNEFFLYLYHHHWGCARQVCLFLTAPGLAAFGVNNVS